MESLGLKLSHELAQVFRVVPGTVNTWRRKLAAGESAHECMPGPAAVLLELLEQGVKTVDVPIVQELAALYDAPAEHLIFKGEIDWTHALPMQRTSPVTLTAPSGHYLVVHSRWLRVRIAALHKAAEAEATTDLLREYYLSLADRYADTRSALLAVPRRATRG